MLTSRTTSSPVPTTVHDFRELSDFYDVNYEALSDHALRFADNRLQAETLVDRAYVDTFEAIGKGVHFVDVSDWLHRCILKLAIIG